MTTYVPSRWDERYGEEGFFYGTEPNDFLKQGAKVLRPRSRILCLGEGEGRNSVYLAGLGHDVTALDASKVGLSKLEGLAKSKGVTVKTVVADLAEYQITPAYWDAIVSIWCHLPEGLRGRVHPACVQGLRQGGYFILEAYTPDQLKHKTGGPPTTDLLMTLPGLRTELQGLKFVQGAELERVVREGRGHSGLSAVVQVLAQKPE